MAKDDLREPGVIAYQSADGRTLFCLQHAPEGLSSDMTPMGAEDLPDGGICAGTRCGVDVLAQPEALWRL
ncbi:hypothetical protein GCM10010293_41150 [Streptomyces griseoflavus]|nr:hypothetical protein GCM10010293_41150 [Streptomyces griseoflavus]